MEINDVDKIVMKLIGNVIPVGETNEDLNRFENLEQLIKTVDILLGKISTVAYYKENPEHSISRSGHLAHEFLNEIKNV